VNDHEPSLPRPPGHDVAPPLWATHHRASWADRTLAHLPLLAGAAIALAAVASVVSTGWTYWNFAGPDGSLTPGERLRVALGASTSPIVAALLVTATVVVLLAPVVDAGRAAARPSGAARAALAVLLVLQVLYGLGALIATIDALALFDPSRRGRFDIPFGQTGPTRVIRVATLLVTMAGALLAAAGRAHRTAVPRRHTVDEHP
jgi:hypothetical protein